MVGGVGYAAVQVAVRRMAERVGSVSRKVHAPVDN